MRTLSRRTIALIGIFAALALVMIGVAVKGWVATIGWIGAFLILVTCVMFLSYFDKKLGKDNEDSTQ